MSGSKDLQIDEDLPFQQKELRVQKILWVLLGLVLLAALAGLIGPGPLSDTAAGTSRFGLNYLHFARWQAPQTLVVSASRPAGQAPLQLAIDRSYLNSMSVQQITPEPTSVKVSGNDFIYSFDATGSGAQTAINFDLQPNVIGSLHGSIAEVTSNGRGPALAFNQLIYP